ncbi:hypothetical protein MKW94_012586 [Papaver nudicaule]|uniref:BLOC-1-related complex subunit 7 n=1 Tax=Papaver nudicaule TaxID=74823 RepID=A0AA41SBD5_PAPNU|nr:hypothetical protein [Papaver nudicaule]
MASPPLFLRSSSSTSSLPSASSSSSSSSIRRVPPTTSREGTAKATVNDHLSQALQSTSNLLQLMQQSSPSQAHLLKLPKNLLAKTATIKNTSQVLEQMPRDTICFNHLSEWLHFIVPHLKTVTQLLSTMETTQLQHSLRVDQPQEEVAGEADKDPEPHS